MIPPNKRCICDALRFGEKDCVLSVANGARRGRIREAWCGKLVGLLENYRMGQPLLKKAFYFTGIFAFIGMLFLGVADFYVILKHSPFLTLSRPTGYSETISNLATPQNPNNAVNSTSSDATVKSVEEGSKPPTGAKVSPEYYLGEITNFYGNVIVILFSTIAILLAISFIYVYTVSRGKAEDLARQALNEESFRITLKDGIGKALAELKSKGDIADWLEEMGDVVDTMTRFEKRLDFLEKTITDESYRTTQLNGGDKLKGEDTDGGNKTI